jgi:hypothetical protein
VKSTGSTASVDQIIIACSGGSAPAHVLFDMRKLDLRVPRCGLRPILQRRAPEIELISTKAPGDYAIIN